MPSWWVVVVFGIGWLVGCLVGTCTGVDHGIALLFLLVLS